MDTASHYDIPDIKESLHVWTVLARFGHQVPEKCGVIKSPLRDDNSPSFSISQEGKLAYDFSTGDSWDVISLYQYLDSCSLHEAIVGCGKMAGLQAGDAPVGLYVPPAPSSKVAKTKPKEETKNWKDELPILTDALLVKMRMAAVSAVSNGYSSDLSRFAKVKGFSKKTMLRAINLGMVGILENFGHSKKSVMVWIFRDWEGNIGAKFRFDPLSSRETIWWQGGAKDFLFGDIATCKSELEDFKRPPIFLTEGESDALTVVQYGYPVLGIVGANAVPTTPKLHAYLSHRAVGIIYDSDHAGIESSSKLANHIESEISGATIFNFTNSSVFGIPSGGDINEAMKEQGEDNFKSVIKAAYDQMSLS